VIPVLGLMILAAGLDHRFFANQPWLLSVSLAEIVSYGAALFLALEIMFRWRHLGWRSVVSRDRSTWLVGLYAAWCLVCAGAVFAMRGDTAGLHYLKDLAPGLLLYGGMIAWVRSEADLDRIVAYVRVMVLVLALLAIAQGVAGGPYINQVDESAYFKLRFSGEEKVDNPVVGTFGSPNAFAVFFGPPLLLALTFRDFLLRHRSVGGMIARLSFALVLIAALLLTQAKMAGGIALLALLGWLVGRSTGISPSRRAVVSGMGVVFAVSVCIVVFLGVMEPNLPQGLTLANLRVRLGLVIEAARLLGQDSLMASFGGGVEIFQENLPVLFNIHNEYLHQGLMWGVVGAVVFSVLLVRGLLRAADLDWSAAIPLGVLASVFFVEAASGNQLQSLFFFLLGLTDTMWRLRAARMASRLRTEFV
jgi:hypothetical protein